MSLKKAIAAVFRGWRAQRGWDQKDVPGIAQGTISRWESGVGLTVDAIEQLLEVYRRSFVELAVEVDRLMGKGGLAELFQAIGTSARESRAGARDPDSTNAARGTTE